MKLYNIFEQSSKTELNISEEKFNELVERDCKPFLRESKGIPAYRGIPYGVESFIHKTVRSDRKPKDTVSIIHNIVDEWFLKHFNHRFRSNAIFITGSIAQAYDYGPVYKVYPIGDIKYVWSAEMEDLKMEFDVKLSKEYDLDNDPPRNLSNVMKEIYKDAVEDILNDAEYDNEDLAFALKSRHEIMLVCKAYYGKKHSG